MRKLSIKLNDKEHELLYEISFNDHVLRKMMGKVERKMANNLVRQGLLVKGIAPESRTVAFYITRKGERAEIIENQREVRQ